MNLQVSKGHDPVPQRPLRWPNTETSLTKKGVTSLLDYRSQWQSRGHNVFGWIFNNNKSQRREGESWFPTHHKKTNKITLWLFTAATNVYLHVHNLICAIKKCPFFSWKIVPDLVKAFLLIVFLHTLWRRQWSESSGRAKIKNKRGKNKWRRCFLQSVLNW